MNKTEQANSPDGETQELENLSISPGEIIIGTMIALNELGQPLVDFPQNKSNQTIAAISTLELTQVHSGRQVALLFANGNIETPVIMGLIHSPLSVMLDNHNTALTNNSSEYVKEEININSEEAVDDIKLDGNKLVFEAKEEIVLKCGESSITLTKSGKVLIRGKYLLNRSSGVNRIMGGSIQVN